MFSLFSQRKKTFAEARVLQLLRGLPAQSQKLAIVLSVLFYIFDSSMVLHAAGMMSIWMATSTCHHQGGQKGHDCMINVYARCVHGSRPPRAFDVLGVRTLALRLWHAASRKRCVMI